MPRIPKSSQHHEPRTLSKNTYTECRGQANDSRISVLLPEGSLCKPGVAGSMGGEVTHKPYVAIYDAFQKSSGELVAGKHNWQRRLALLNGRRLPGQAQWDLGSASARLLSNSGDELSINARALIHTARR